MIKLFEQFSNEQKIHDICKKYNIKNYSINTDGSIDVDGNVDLSNQKLKDIPLIFNRVSGIFYCSRNRLTSLEGCPKEVGGNFYCYNNHLTSLIGCSERIGGGFNCSQNKLTSLKYIPRIINGSLYINHNPISVIDVSVEVDGNIFIKNTNIPKEIEYELSDEQLRILFEHGVDYDIFDKNGSVNHKRLERMFKDFNI